MSHPFLSSLSSKRMLLRRWRRRSLKRGFVLVACILLLALITVLVIALLGFTRSEIQGDAAYENLGQARRNAEVGLRRAMQQLQEQTGPDRRITARAELLDSDPATPVIDGVIHPYWTGVWRNPVNPASILSNLTNTSLNDLMTSRTGLLDSPVWLVSGNSTDGTAPDPLKDIARPIRLVGSGSGPTDADQHVFAGLQDIKDNENRLVGRFAFWVGDEGVKARANLADPWRDQGSGGSDPFARYSSEITQRANVEILDSGFSSAGGNNTFDSLVSRFQSKLGSWLQLQLLVPAGDTDLLTERFHDLTAYSQGVLADVRAGGLKKDLSLAFEMTDADFLDTEEFGNGTAWSVPGGTSTKAPTPLGGGTEVVTRRGALFTAVPANTLTPPGPSRTKYLFFEPGDQTDRSQALLEAGYIRGPSWHLLRDYYRLYKNPLLAAPSPIAPIRIERIPDTFNHIHWAYQRVYDPDATDIVNQNLALPDSNNGNTKLQVSRAAQTTVAPIVTRVRMLLAYRARLVNTTTTVNNATVPTQEARLDLSVTPLVTVMNPYNHPIQFREMQVSMSISPNFRIATTWWVQSTPGTGAFQQLLSRSKLLVNDGNVSLFSTHLGKREDSSIRNYFIFRLTQDGTKNNATPVTIGPGESRVFSVTGSDGVVNTSDSDRWDADISNDNRTNVQSNYGRRVTVCLGPLADPSAIINQPCISFVDVYSDPTKPPATALSAQNTNLLGVTQNGTLQVPGAPNIDADKVRMRMNFTGNNERCFVGVSVMAPGESTAVGTQNFIFGSRGVISSGTTGLFREALTYGPTIDNDGMRGFAYRMFLSWPENDLRTGTSASPGRVLQSALDASASGWVPAAALDFFLKPQLHTVSVITSTRTPTYTSFRLPLLAGFNPRAYAANRNTGYGSPYSGAETWDAEFFPINSWPEVQLDANARGYWGRSHDPASGDAVVPLFELPTAPMLSLGGFRHADISIVQNQSAYAIGESWAHPLVSASRTWTLYNSHQRVRMTGASNNNLQVNTVADWSYLANEGLWDRYFLSGLAPQPGKTLQQVADDFDTYSATPDGTAGNPLPNARLNLIGDFMDRTRSFRQHLGISGNSVTGESYQIPARRLLLAGAFNVNSVSKDAWKAMLGGRHSVQRAILRSSGYALTTDSNRSFFGKFNVPFEEDSSSLWQGGVSLTEAQLDELAVEIVREVKVRGPFRDMADFVNRRLLAASADPDGTRLRGALQAAIDRTSINSRAEFTGANSLVDISATAQRRDDDYTSPPSTSYGGVSRAELRLGRARDFGQEGVNYAASENNGAYEHLSVTPILAGSSKYLTQGDLLNVLGPTLAARSDTFRVRFYGEDVHPVTGRVQARAWGEAVIQRFPEPVRPLSTDPAASPSLSSEPQDPEVLGRLYKIVSMRWLDPSEI